MLQLMKMYSILLMFFLTLTGSVRAVEEVPARVAPSEQLLTQSNEFPSIPLALALKLNSRIKRNPQLLPWTTQRPIVNRISNHNWADESACIRNCPATNQWKPVCGTDNLSYANMNKLRCAQMCGKQVAPVYNGACYTTEPPSNTSPIYSG